MIVLSQLSQEAQTAITNTRDDVARLHAELPRNNLVVWTEGTVSQRVEADGHTLFVIKPAEVSYDELWFGNMVVCSLDGTKVTDGTPHSLKPPGDTAVHAYMYQNMKEVGGVAHTHSTYATAWASRGESVPCVLTMMAAEFGGPLPVGPFAVADAELVGRAIVEALHGSRSPAVLMQNHGPFTFGPDGKAAVKTAIMVEEVARTVHLARQLGEPIPIPQQEIDSLYERYRQKRQTPEQR